MKKNHFIKYTVMILTPIAILISLFPPFQFNENQKILRQKGFSYKMIDKIPIKQYDFLFGNVKKYITMDYDTCYVKFYNKNELARYKQLWKDCQFSFYNSSMDTVFTKRKFLIKREGKISYNFNFNYIDSLAALVSKSIAILPETIKYYPGYKISIEKPKNYRFYYDDNVENAINYVEVRKDYIRDPSEWDYRYEINGIKEINNYNIYEIKFPMKPLLKRNLLFYELLVEYFLAFCLSLIIGFIITKLKLKKIVT